MEKQTTQTVVRAIVLMLLLLFIVAGARAKAVDGSFATAASADEQDLIAQERLPKPNNPRIVTVDSRALVAIPSSHDAASRKSGLAGSLQSAWFASAELPDPVGLVVMGGCLMALARLFRRQYAQGFADIEDQAQASK